MISVQTNTAKSILNLIEMIREQGTPEEAAARATKKSLFGFRKGNRQ